MKNFFKSISKLTVPQIQKAIVAGTGFVVLLGNTLFVHGSANHYVTVIAGAGVFAGVFILKNEPTIEAAVAKVNALLGRTVLTVTPTSAVAIDTAAIPVTAVKPTVPPAAPPK